MLAIAHAALAALLAAAPASGTPAPERQNALAFDNGATLLQDGGSYGSGLASWSAWSLADGSESNGWCSPQGKPTGIEHVWSLDKRAEGDGGAGAARSRARPPPGQGLRAGAAGRR